jgi:hypothetical protein
MNIIRFTVVLLLTFSSSGLIAQFASNFNSSNNWSMNKREIFFSIGATQFLGDLGGRDQIGTQNSIIDLDWPATRYNIGAGFRYRFHPMFATSTHLNAGMISGDDANTDEIVRRSRNLSFRSPIVELSQRLDIILLANEKIGARYKIKGLSGSRSKADQLYVFSGIGGIFFNPQMRINGAWTNLRPLSTEGQGLDGGVDPYSRITLTIPTGIGFKLGLGRFWRIGMEFTYHKTFSDYIDDVSTNYYDPNVLASTIGAEAAYASNPAIENHSWFAPGQQRGNPEDNDAYFLANIVLTRNITYPKSKGGARVKWKGRTKF